MKKILVSTCFVTLILAGVSCDEQNKAAETTTTTTEGTTTTTNNGTSTTIVSDTPRRTTINVNKGGTSVSTKSGTDVSVDNKGIRVGSKDIKVDIKTGN
ncbi:MAG: hypothetical protein WKF35_02235 [Ferruginibacter sp.]